MSMEIIKRLNKGTTKDTINRVENDAPQIAYNSEGRITVRIPQYEGDVLVVFDRPLSREIVRFIKSGISELPTASSWCCKCSTDMDMNLPF